MNATSVRDSLVGLGRYITVLIVSVVLLGLAAGGATAQTAQVHVWTAPSLFPAFSPSITDYVVRCQPANSVHVFVLAPKSTTVSIDKSEPRTGAFTQAVGLNSGQSFQFSVTMAGQTSTHFVRCLPLDFPHFAASRTGATQAQWYVTTPFAMSVTSLFLRQYVAIFDNNGVPVWWMRMAETGLPWDATLLPNDDLIWLRGLGQLANAEEYNLDGSLVRTLTTAGGTTNVHDIQQLPNGNYLIGRNVTRSGVDMTACGGPQSGQLKDLQLQELTPSGDVAWSWTASDHIPLSEVATNWQSRCKTSGDVYHWNSVEPVGNDFIVSFRHLDAVYRIDGTTGAIEWKLGGTPRLESLTVIGDPLAGQSTLDSQHDARILPDGTLTIFDNGTSYERPPRDVRFAIDETARTATLLESVTDPNVSYVLCCGSTRKLPGGDWVTSWGESGVVTEQTGTGEIVYQLSFTSRVFSYRAIPVLPGLLSKAELRAGMDSQFPR